MNPYYIFAQKSIYYPNFISRGVDMLSAQEMGKKVIWALSIPGKVAPITAADAIKKTLYNILDERGILGG